MLRRHEDGPRREIHVIVGLRALLDWADLSRAAASAHGTLATMAAPSQSTRALAVGLAFLVSATSLGAALMGWLTRGELRVTLLVGGLLMLALGISGVRRLKRPPGGS